MYKQNAYLIMAHADFEILKKILIILDDEQADFYVHIDAKAKDFDKNELKLCIRKSDLYFIDSMNIQWGDRSQIDLEMALLKVSTKKEYGYYHLISGTDFPLKRPDEINKFFAENAGKNYINFDVYKEETINRLKYYHIFQKKIGRKKTFFAYLQKSVLLIQKLIGVNRIKGKENLIYKGANWFSITHDLASYVVLVFPEYDKMFDLTVCADEVFLQTIAIASPYKDTIVKDCLRQIDWKRGNPYVYRKNDFNELIKSKNIFARKFSMAVDSEIIENLYSYLKS